MTSLVAAVLLLAGVDPALDLDRFMVEVRRVQEHDIEAWATYWFRRIVVRRKLSESGEVTEKEVLVFQVTPTADGFDEWLVHIDGREPTEREVRHHRKRARFAAHYETIVTEESGETDPRDEDGYSFRRLLSMPSYEYVGEEDVRGRPCHHLRFSPLAEGEDGDIADRLSHAMAGSLWISTEGLHLVRAQARMARSVSVGFGLAGVTGLSVDYEATPVAADTWLPSTIEVDTTGRILASTFRKSNRYRYEDYQPLDPR